MEATAITTKYSRQPIVVDVPNALSPQQRMPVSAIINAHVWPAPAAMLDTPVSASDTAGAFSCVMLPVPNWPLLFRPKQRTAVLVVSLKHV